MPGSKLRCLPAWAAVVLLSYACEPDCKRTFTCGVQTGEEASGGSGAAANGTSAAGDESQGGSAASGSASSDMNSGSASENQAETPTPSGGSGGDTSGAASGGQPGSGGSGDDASGGTTDSVPSDGSSSPAGAGGLAPTVGEVVCQTGQTRCTPEGHESCNANQWQSDPCPLNLPTCEADACTVRGPAMVAVNGFFVDSTEVTVADYRAFLDATAGDTSGQPSECGWNTEFWDPALAMNPDTWPITSVDWCDAFAYCAWADKHLCGQIGGGAVAAADALSSTASQWFLACGGPVGSSHPNAAPLCNSTGGFGNLAPVASFTECEGFFPGLFDLEGNAAEWVDSCDSQTGATDTCHLLGGSIIDNQSFCDEVFDQPRDIRANPFGFRCCNG